MFWKMSNSTATLKNKHFVRYERERERYGSWVGLIMSCKSSTTAQQQNEQ